MLKHLSIRNYALIQSLDIDFGSGFTTITGETGAGKSILMGALSLILGNRADTSVLKDQNEKCVIEGQFEIADNKLKSWFHENDFDFSNHLIIRREIAAGGKSRAFINDSPAQLTQLKDLGEYLVDIHSQHQNLLLKENNFQLNVLDVFSGNKNLLNDYSLVFTELQTIQSEHNKQINLSRQDKTELDYLQFQFEQLASARLTDGEQEELEKESEMLSHAEEIKLQLTETYATLAENDPNIIGLVKELKTKLQSIVSFYENASDISQRLESVLIELKDIAGEADKSGERISVDPARLQHVNDRLDLIFSLQKKHHVTSVKELIQIKDSFENRISEINQREYAIEKLEKEYAACQLKAKAIATELDGKRQENARKLEKQITGLCVLLGMPNTQFIIRVDKTPELNETGMNAVQFLFTANKNYNPELIEKVASGGELSRLMLAIKYISSRKSNIRTIIFDEIDTGVSGEIADKMGEMMTEMATASQVISITHLPQIASKGHEHFLVYKSDVKNTTQTSIKKLNPDERITEIAKMLSGKELSDAAINNARELLVRK